MLQGNLPVQLLVLVAMGLAMIWYVRNRKDGSVTGYASRAAVKKLLATVPPPGTLIMGYDKRSKKFICTSREAWIGVIAGQRAGKSSTVIEPNLHYWVGPRLIASVKADLMFETAVNDKHTFLFAPGASEDILRNAPIPTIGYSVLDQIIELVRQGDYDSAYTAALRRGQALCGSLDMSSTKNGSYWEGAAEGLLASCFLAVALRPDEYSITDLCQAPSSKETLQQFLDILIMENADPLAISILAETVEKPPNDPAGAAVKSTATVALKPYRFPEVRATAERPDRFRPADLFKEDFPRTLFLLGTAINQDSFAPILTALLDEVIQYQYERAMRILIDKSVKNDKAFTPTQTLLLALDEAANIFPYKQMATLASTGAGSGIMGIVAYQDLSQARKRLGEEDVQTLLNNLHGLCVLHGTKDDKTLTTVSNLVGERDKTTRGGSSTKGQNTASWNEGKETILTPARIRTIPKGKVVIIYGSEHPIMADAAHQSITGPVRLRTTTRPTTSGPGNTHGPSSRPNERRRFLDRFKLRHTPDEATVSLVKATPTASQPVEPTDTPAG